MEATSRDVKMITSLLMQGEKLHANEREVGAHPSNNGCLRCKIIFLKPGLKADSSWMWNLLP